MPKIAAAFSIKSYGLYTAWDASRRIRQDKFVGD